MLTERRIIGTRGEEIAANYLEGKGFKVLFRQKRTPFGEIDLVCLDKQTCVFVEVKTRRTNQYGPPQAAVTRLKFRHMVSAAQAFLSERHWLDRSWRLDVVAIDWLNLEEPRVVHFPAIDSAATF